MRDPEAYAVIHRETDGIPRRINTLCNRLLLGASLEDHHTITGIAATEAAAELRLEIDYDERPGTRAVPALMAAFGYLGFFELAGRLRPLGDFVAATMQRGSPSPASHDYSDPYINCFYFIPRERSDLQQRAAAAG